MLVYFLAPWQSNAGHYMAGDMAELPADVAANVLKSQVARELTPEEKERLGRRTVRVGAASVMVKESTPSAIPPPPAPAQVAVVAEPERTPADPPAPEPTPPPSAGRNRRGR